MDHRSGALGALALQRFGRVGEPPVGVGADLVPYEVQVLGGQADGA
ncbi:hypothetical protein [Streptomyces sp. NBC_01408]|nr:hypothetical protein [Streptomyces sp. NBC_01408]MCX4695320.1 hypothetical protein [Streptomyces sp. NBC_01408]